MITTDELNIANTSATKKDFYQIYPEILDLVSKISKRWDPQSSNESDPGIVLLKLLAFIADKTNYNIDKNILECFMPSATQPESMRKLCDMMGYDISYYKSASTILTVMWSGDLDATTQSIFIPKYTSIGSSKDDSVKYVTTEDVTISQAGVKTDIPVVEGVINDLTVSNSPIIKLYNLADNRIYLPEQIVAENGIFITSVNDRTREWRLTNNLYTQISGSYVYKFGYDSTKKLPYIEFPQDISNLIGDGLEIKYLRTTGVSGNIKAKTLDKVNTIANVKKITRSTTPPDNEEALTEDDEQYLNLANLSATVSGRDVETLDDAYNSFKKTVGTFDTLVTCRDYANAIYNLVDTDQNQRPIVSNCQVGDIRDDVNRSCKVMTFNEYGIAFVDRSIKKTVNNEEVDLISPFDLYIYPLNPINTDYSSTSYNKSFKPYLESQPIISKKLQDLKTINHEIKIPESGDLFLIKNIYKLSGKINTSYKVNTAEKKQILENIYQAIFANFNARKVDFGEELVYDNIVKVIQEADSRIKSVAIDEPKISSVYMTATGAETLLFNNGIDSGIDPEKDAELIKILAKNIVAGRLRMFKYNDYYAHEYGQQRVAGLDGQYGDPKPEVTPTSITHVTTALNVPTGNTPFELRDNENIIFVSDNYVEDYIYSYGVNYFWKPSPTTADIQPNQEYKLVEGDKLSILYTDLNDNDIYREYTSDGIREWRNINGQAIEQPSKTWSGIIKCDAKLVESNPGSSAYARPDWLADTEGVPANFLMINTSNQISVMKKQVDIIPATDSTQSYYPIIWITKDGNLVNNHILEEGEYFFLTDVTKTSLLTYGPGTKIVFNDNPNDKITLKWPNAKQVDLDQVANEGLTAFDSAMWFNFKPGVTKGKDGSQQDVIINTIGLNEMRIITLGKGSTLTKLTLEEASGDQTAYLDNSYKVVTEATYMIDGNVSSLPKISSNNEWSARSQLNLNVGPNQTQTLILGRHSFVIYFNNGYDVDLLNDQSGGNTDINIRCNYMIQETSSVKDGVISLRIFKENPDDPDHPIEIDDTLIIPFVNASIETTGGKPIQLNNFADHYTQLDLKTTSVTLPVSIADDWQGIMFVYLKKGDGTDTRSISVTGAGATISIYNPDPDNNSSITNQPSITLSDDNRLYTFVVNSDTTAITINKAEDDLVIISELNLIDADNSGLDLEHLGLKSTAQASSFTTKLLKNIRDLAGTDFCYNAYLDNELLIDYDVTDPMFWFDNNNVARKFVISQISSDLSDIQLSKGSQI